MNALTDEHKSIRVLLLQPDLDLAQVATDNLRLLGVSDMECVANGIECIACFESYRPHLVILDADGDDMPARFILQAMKQLDPTSRAVLWAVSSAKGAIAEARTIGAVGTVSFPLDHKSLTQLLESDPIDQPLSNDETIQGFVDDSASLWNYQGEAGDSLAIEAAEINQRRKFQHSGDLKVVGNLRSVELLEVTGRLEVQGNVVDSHVRCRGDMFVFGGIIGCNKMGVFARRMLEVVRIKESTIVCGGTLLLGETCENSVVNVAGRMIGKSRSSVLAGGKARVGEHMMMGIMGDEDACSTEVELAANIFFQHWAESRRKLFVEGQARCEIKADRVQWFEQQVASRKFFIEQADLFAQWIYPGVKVRIADEEELVIQPCSSPVRVHNRIDSDGESGIAFERRAQPFVITTL